MRLNQQAGWSQRLLDNAEATVVPDFEPALMEKEYRSLVRTTPKFLALLEQQKRIAAQEALASTLLEIGCS